VNAVARDDEVGIGRGAVFKMQVDGIGALVHTREGVAEVEGAAGDGPGESGLELGAMEGEAGAIAGGQRESFNAIAVFVLHKQAAKRAAGAGEAGENFRVDLIEGTHGVGPEAHAGAYFPELGGAFVDVYVEADFAEGDGGGEPADAAADDCRTFHECPQNRIGRKGDRDVRQRSIAGKQIVAGAGERLGGICVVRGEKGAQKEEPRPGCGRGS